MAYVNCLQHLIIFSEILVMPGKLHFPEILVMPANEGEL